MAGCFKSALKVLLGDVTNFMSNNRSEFAFRLGSENEPCVETNMAIRSGKGIDSMIVDHKEVKVPIGLLTEFCNSVT